MENTKAVLNENGEYVIPASRRPDGSWRKERVVKAGYLPQEEVKVYETSATRMRSKGIPGLAPQPAPVSKPPAAQSKKEKKENTPKPSVPSKPVEKVLPVASLSLEEEKTVDPAKKLKALRKKLRDIEEIAKKNVVELTPEQSEKLSRKDAVEAEIRELEASIAKA